MEFNNRRERKRFETEWAKLRQEYHNAGMSEDAIQSLYLFDFSVFKRSRSIAAWEEPFENESEDGESKEYALLHRYASLLSKDDTYFADADRFSWQVLSMALGGGMSSRLFQTVREKHGLCYSIGSFTAAYKETGMLAISTAVGRDSEEKALALIREEIEKFRQDGITDKELRTARELIKSSIILSLESSSSRMNRLGSGLLLLGKCLTADEIIERYDAVTTESVLALAREKLAPEMMGFSAVGRLAPAEDYLSVFGK